MSKEHSAEFQVPSISCGGCADAIRRILGSVDGVGESSVDVDTKTVTVSFTEAEISEADIRRRLADAGYPAE